jgi:N-succinyldiaminopimelate aminotransferase
MPNPPATSLRRNRILNERLEEFGTTIFAEMSALAIATDSINLGQGFPDTDGPEEIKQAAIEAIRVGHNQYPPGRGVAPLLQAVATHQSRFYGLEFDPESEVLITAGATEAIAAAMIGLCEPGDEVVLFEPYYDSYAAAIAIAGARRVVVPLRPPTWSFDPDELRRAITPKTRLILVNTPHNPTGKVFTRSELQSIVDVALEFDLFVVTDEVYEHLIFEGTHLPISGFPGMWERTLTISSAGKSFSFTGWKIGWVTGVPQLVNAVQSAKQFLTYVNGAPFQYAIAQALTLPDTYFEALRINLRNKRDLLAEGLASLDFDVLPTAGTYFLNTDVTRFDDGDGDKFCRSLPIQCGVVAIPCSVFFDTKQIGHSLVRWAFCKQDSLLRTALERLAKLVAPNLKP